jgi:hypothetical protein
LHAALATVEGSAWGAAHLASGFAANVVAWERGFNIHAGQPDFDPAGKEAELRRQLLLFRDIFSNLFHPLPGIPATVLAWGNGAVTGLARAIYEESAFDQLPVLADMLEDAGCTNPDILDHLRGPAAHARGCWAVDLVLGLS